MLKRKFHVDEKEILEFCAIKLDDNQAKSALGSVSDFDSVKNPSLHEASVAREGKKTDWYWKEY